MGQAVVSETKDCDDERPLTSSSARHTVSMHTTCQHENSTMFCMCQTV